MRKSTIEKIEEHINMVTEIPEAEKKQYRKTIFTNIIFCIIFIIYITAVIVGANMLQEEVFIKCYKIASMITVLISITLFEYAYTKDNGYIALYGIETLLVSLFTLFSKSLLKSENSIWIKISGLYICIYYLIKCLIIYLRKKNIYLRQNNDLQEITKKESQDKLKPIMEQKNKENINNEKIKKKTNTKKKIVSEHDKNKGQTTKNSKKKNLTETQKKEVGKKKVIRKKGE